MARIAGGYRTVAEFQQFELDASASGRGAASDESLAAAWRCEPLTGGRAQCPEPSLLGSSLLAAFAMSEGSYRFTVSVSDGHESDSAAVVVEVIPGEPLPVVTLTALREHPDPSAELQLSSSLSASSTVYSLAARSWHVTEIDGLGGPELGRVALDAPSALLSDPGGANLVVSRGVFAPGGVYRFSLTATFAPPAEVAASEQTSLGSIELQFNQPPFGGALVVSYEGQGLALLDTYTLRATGWSDPEGHTPLTYSYSYSEEGSAVQTSLGAAAVPAYTEIKLPAGRNTVYVTVHDQRGATATANVSVTTAAVTVTSEIASSLITAGKEAIEDGKPAATLMLANGLSTALNQAGAAVIVYS